MCPPAAPGREAWMWGQEYALDCRPRTSPLAGGLQGWAGHYGGEKETLSTDYIFMLDMRRPS